ncbi:MAG TPA: hypothetical protein DDY20_13455 [Desulfobulbaceae bacterium]|nr:hypothetical protein [Desulfobulbaceae bacterium]
MSLKNIGSWGLLVMVMLGALMVVLSGCGIVASTTPYGSASIVSEPPGAKIVNLKDGDAIGTTPLQYTWETEDGKAEYIQLILTTPGYEDEVTSFWINPRYDSKEEAEKNPQAIKVNMKTAK